jgi:hypothetical protein
VIGQYKIEILVTHDVKSLHDQIKIQGEETIVVVFQHDIIVSTEPRLTLKSSFVHFKSLCLDTRHPSRTATCYCNISNQLFSVPVWYRCEGISESNLDGVIDTVQ